MQATQAGPFRCRPVCFWRTAAARRSAWIT